MMKLTNETKGRVLLQQIQIAKNLSSRMKGLLGRKEISSEEALWIHACNSIHTCFMNFPIDVIFLNRKMEIIKVKKNVKPWKIILPVWRATSVIECASGNIERWMQNSDLQEGDVLHVGH